MQAAKTLGIDYRWIWLWAEQGKVWHVEVESRDGRHKTFYAMEDLKREVDRLRSIDSGDTPDWAEGYSGGYPEGSELERLVDRRLARLGIGQSVVGATA